MRTARKVRAGVLPSWFPLEIYDTDLSLEQWLEAFVVRMAVRTKWENGQELSPEEHEQTFLSLITTRASGNAASLFSRADKPKQLWPIQEPSVLQILYAAALVKTGGPEVQAHIAALPQHADQFVGSLFSEASEYLSDVSFGEVGDHSRWIDVVGGKWALAAIDLDQDDETLEFIFKGWLAMCREGLGSPAPRVFDDADRTRWAGYQVLPAFDLKHWSDIKGVKFTDAQMGRALWDRPGGDLCDFDLTERYRKTVKPMVDKVFHWNYVLRLWRQLELAKAIENLAAKVQSE